MNLLDNLLSICAPMYALRRKHAKIALEALSSRNYEAAKISRRTDGWTTASTSASSEIQSAGSHLRDRARDLVRNNPYARKALRVFSDNFVGTGIIPEARTASDKLNKQIMMAWENWISECDVEGNLNFYGIQALVIRSVFESGECFVKCIDTAFDIDDSNHNGRVPMQLQVLEADHLDTQKNSELDGGRYIRQGIEFDKNGRRVAYWLFKNHPGDAVSYKHGSSASVRIPADEILHVFIKERPGQIRGASSFAASLLRLKDLDDYDDAELWRKKIEACFAAFVIQNSGSEGPTLGSIATTGKSAKDGRVENFRPGMIEYLKPGEDVRFGSPTGDSSYESYQRVQLHAIAAGLGVTYEQLTGDLSQVNYSSLRAGLLEFRRMIETLRWQMFIPMFCEQVWKRFIVRAFIAGLIAKIDTRVNWTAPKFEMIDPVKDAEADTLMMRNGTLTLREAIANRGFDPDTQIEEIARTNDLLDLHGIVLDSDARLTSRNGTRANTNETTNDKQKPDSTTNSD